MNAIDEPLSRLLLDLADLAAACIDKPYLAFGRRAAISIASDDVRRARALPSDGVRLVGDEASTLVVALARLADGDRDPWQEIARLLVPKVRADAFAAFQAEQRPSP